MLLEAHRPKRVKYSLISDRLQCTYHLNSVFLRNKKSYIMHKIMILALVLFTCTLHAQEADFPKTAIGISFQNAEYDMGVQTNTYKLNISRYLKHNLELRLNSNLNFLDDLYALKSHGIGIYKYGQFKEKAQSRFPFLSRLQPYMGLEMEYNRRKYIFPFDGIGTNQVLKANLIMGLKYDAFKHLSFFAEARAISTDVISNDGYSGTKYFSKLYLLNGFTAGAKIRF